MVTLLVPTGVVGGVGVGVLPLPPLHPATSVAVNATVPAKNKNIQKRPPVEDGPRALLAKRSPAKGTKPSSRANEITALRRAFAGT